MAILHYLEKTAMIDYVSITPQYKMIVIFTVNGHDCVSIIPKYKKNSPFHGKKEVSALKNVKPRNRAAIKLIFKTFNP
ncbi:hypothetical protein MTBBW1_10017 [Desulfamplus magnetovallimortis]|uniref:Uncharacterized protein n=1 Tax=Desulfamplus magnetovallimortis TaxID=1246637 RepID=A0A1W1H4R5_9BACT|nr:hypothetical protein MTBBW1_10017 [Desulfamplus magnetovallimortis]